MKLNTKQIPAFVKTPMKSCIGALVYGPDEGQIREYASQIAKAVVKDPNDPFSVAELSEEALKAEPTRLHDELFAISLLGGMRLVRVDAASETVGKIVMDIYEGAQRIPEAYLLVIGGDLNTRSSLRALFERHPQLATLPCYRDEGFQLDQLIQQHLQLARIQADRETLQYLAANLGADRRVTLKELEKIVLYCGESQLLTLEDAMQLVGDNAELTLDDLGNALADGNARATDRIMQKLLREAMQPIQAIRALQRYFQRLHFLAGQMQQLRMTADQAITEIKPKVFFKQVPFLRRQLGVWTPQSLEAALALFSRGERLAKETGASAEAQLQHCLTQVILLLENIRSKR